MLVRMGGQSSIGPLISDDRVAEDALQGLGEDSDHLRYYSTQIVPPQDLFGLGYYSTLLKQREMMAPQLTEEETEMVEMGPYYGMNDIDPETRQKLIIANRIAVPIWLIAGIFGDAMGSRTGSAVSAVAGGVITANLATIAIGSGDYSTGGRFFLGALAAVAAFFTVADTISVFKKKADSPTFKTKLTRLTRAVAAPVPA